MGFLYGVFALFPACQSSPHVHVGAADGDGGEGDVAVVYSIGVQLVVAAVPVNAFAVGFYHVFRHKGKSVGVIVAALPGNAEFPAKIYFS